MRRRKRGSQLLLTPVALQPPCSVVSSRIQIFCYAALPGAIVVKLSEIRVPRSIQGHLRAPSFNFVSISLKYGVSSSFHSRTSGGAKSTLRFWRVWNTEISEL